MPAFLDVPTRRGEKTFQRIRIGEYSDGSPVEMPVVSIAGRRPGPTLYVQAGLHGDEMTGIEICRRVIASVEPDDLAGTVIAVPVANVPAHTSRTRGYLHEERWLIDVNRIFPGNAHGLLSERLAHTLIDQFIGNADFSIDLHSALDGCDIRPFVYIDPDDNDNGTLTLREKHGRTFGTPYIYYKSRHARLGTSDLSRSISAQSDAAGFPLMSAEMGESRRVSHEVVPMGTQGVLNVMSSMGMLTSEPALPAQQREFREIHLVHAERGGGLRLTVNLGDELDVGQELGEVTDVFGRKVQSLQSPVAGFALRLMRLGSVNTGAEIAWIAR